MLLINPRGTPRGSWKESNAGRSPTCHLWMADANSHMPYHAHSALCCGRKESLSECHGHGIARAQHGMCELHCVNNMGTAWYV
jgi:hypothetical protein